MHVHMGEKKYFKEYEVHYYEVDYRKKLTLTNLVDYLGDIAIYHSEDVGVGIEYLKEKKLAWVLYSWDINVDRFPSLGEKVNIMTIPTGFRKFQAFRKFEVMDQEGNIIARANTVWFLIDTERRRPLRIIENMYKAYSVDINGGEYTEVFKVEKPEKFDGELEFKVRYSDIDTNKHVNNSKYVAWAMETVPLDVVHNYTLKNMRANYEKEAHYGDIVKAVIEVRKNGDEIVCLHRIKDAEEKDLTILNTVWSPN